MTGTYAEWMIFCLILFVVIMLIVAMAFEHKAEVEQARANEAIEKLCDMLYVLDHAHIETGSVAVEITCRVTILVITAGTHLWICGTITVSLFWKLPGYSRGSISPTFNGQRCSIKGVQLI